MPTDDLGLVERLRPRHVADEPLARAVVSEDQAERRAAVSAYLVANNALKREAAEALAAKDAALERLLAERDEARAKLFPYADDNQIRGMSWGGFYLIGNDKSIKELRRIENAAAQIEVYRAAFDERMAAAEAQLDKLKEALTEIASMTQTEKLLWWQIRARQALQDSKT